MHLKLFCKYISLRNTTFHSQQSLISLFNRSDNEILACKIDTFLLLFQSCPITKAVIIWKRNVPFWDTFLLQHFYDQSSQKADLAITLYYLFVCLALYILLRFEILFGWLNWQVLCCMNKSLWNLWYDRNHLNFAI